MNNVVPTLIEVTSDVYAFGTEETYPFERTGGAVPLPEETRKEPQAKHRTGAWLVSGALHRPSEEAVAPGIARVRAIFEGTGNARYHSHEQMLENPVHKIHVDTSSGEPTDSELGLLDSRPGGGATWSCRPRGWSARSLSYNTRPHGGSSPSTGSTTRRSSSAVRARPVPCTS